MNTFLLRIAQIVPFLAVTLAPAAPGRTATIQPASPDGFIAENDRAMDKMMSAMTITPSGNVDRDFVAMMVPHHQGAIDMAMAELHFGKDETLRRMAQEIIVEQQQEIVAMRLASDKLARTTPVAPEPPDLPEGKPAMQHMHDAHVHGG